MEGKKKTFCFVELEEHKMAGIAIAVHNMHNSKQLVAFWRKQFG